MANDVFTNVGLDGLLESLIASISHLAVGSGTTLPAVGDTTLQTELSRQVTTNESASASGGEGTAVFESFLPTGAGNGTLTEFGIFTASVGGDMYQRGQPVSPVVKTSAKQLRVTLTIKLRKKP